MFFRTVAEYSFEQIVVLVHDIGAAGWLNRAPDPSSGSGDWSRRFISEWIRMASLARPAAS
jgi:hypothetical protein